MDARFLDGDCESKETETRDDEIDLTTAQRTSNGLPQSFTSL